MTRRIDARDIARQRFGKGRWVKAPPLEPPVPVGVGGSAPRAMICIICTGPVGGVVRRNPTCSTECRDEANRRRSRARRRRLPLVEKAEAMRRWRARRRRLNAGC
jgi:hypothetical protein